MKGNESIAVISIVGAVILCLAYVIIVALKNPNRKFEARLIWKGLIEFVLKITGHDPKPQPALPGNVEPSPATGGGPAAPSRVRPWFFRHWRAVVLASLALLLIVLPATWWLNQPAPWRMLLSYEFNEMLSLLRHGARDPLVITRGQASLDRVTRMVEMRTDSLAHDHYKNEEIWIIDHYWQYWNTTNLREYLRVNKTFVAGGGKIHRMFFLTDKELHEPEVQTLLQAQCQIGRLGADQTGSGFELWRANPERMKMREEYDAISQAFRQLPNTDKTFDNFDVMQFSDTLYYSSDFSTDYRVMGSSTWIFDPNLVSKIDLRPLFKKSIAQRISCDQPLPTMNAATAGRVSVSRL